ncbi:MAG: hypothetical protein ABIZ57_11355 [Candidatus Limnocylindria bacterium]
MPGGGQAGLTAPPPPPPPDPAPIVVALSTDPEVPSIEQTAAGTPKPVAAIVDIAEMSEHAVVRFERAVDAVPRWSWSTAAPTSRQAILRLVVMQLVVDRAISNLPLRIGPGG